MLKNVPIGEFMKLPPIKDKVQHFFDKIPIVNAPKINYESCRSQSLRGKEVEEDPLIHIHSIIYERKIDGQPPIYLTLHIN